MIISHQHKFIFIPQAYFSLRKPLRKNKLGKKIRWVLKLLKLNQLTTAILKANRKCNKTFSKTSNEFLNSEISSETLQSRHKKFRKIIK